MMDMNKGLVLACAVVAMGGVGSAAESVQIASVTELKKRTLEELVETPVISAFRSPEPWFTAPYAIDVQTDEEIRRSGAVRLPDALRYVTGLQVARGAGSSYAISARGFNSSIGNKLQVMMDGRSLYTPLLSGTFWEIQDTMLEDLDRIEVVRGPGGSLWGANAVNGVINIISKSARDTQGLLAFGGGGNEERFFAGLRYGGAFSSNSFYRVYLKENLRDDQVFRDGRAGHDWMRQAQIGFRTDTYLFGTDQLTVQGDALYNEFGLPHRPDDAENTAGNFLARWSRDMGDYGDVRVQAYYDRGVRDLPLQFWEDRQTFDIDAQHHFHWCDWNNIVWGFNYRGSFDETGTRNRTARFRPANRYTEIFGGFVQDEITLVEKLLRFTLGTRVDHNTYSGVEVQPSGRFTITPNENHTIWAAVSRAVRAPTRGDNDIVFSSSPTGVPVLVRGDHDFVSEELLAYEAGYRVQLASKVSIDVAAYYNDYDHLRTQEPTPGTGIPLVAGNEREGEVYGGEVAVKFQVTDWARISASYTRIEQDLRFKRGSGDTTGGTTEGNDPSDLAVLHLALDLPQNIELDIYGRYTDALPNPRVDSYVAFDARIAWRPCANFELSLVGQNLTDPQHNEFGGRTFQEVERSVFAKATLRF